jgi:PQQ-dependent catabolism-associated CXXCW motif protein
VSLRTAASAITLALVALIPAAATEAPPPEPASFRLDDYHAPTPLTVSGRPAIATAEARRLWETQGAVFIDVLAAPRRPDTLPEGSLWLPKPHEDIPGSIWLPDSGLGALNGAFEDWLRRKLADIVRERAGATIVFYCKADCWMSWNATRRALAWGYSDVGWFRDGLDGWREAGLPVAAATPPDDMPR